MTLITWSTLELVGERFEPARALGRIAGATHNGSIIVCRAFPRCAPTRHRFVLTTRIAMPSATNTPSERERCAECAIER